MNINEKKIKYKIVDETGKVYETFFFLQTALTFLPKIKKVYFDKDIKLIKI